MMLTNKTVVITGSSRGIGLATAEACAREGASVVVSSRGEAATGNAVKYLREKGYRVSGVRADVTSMPDLKTLLGRAVSVFGRVDVWINNAGISGGFRTLQSIPPTEIQAVVETNLLGTLYVAVWSYPTLSNTEGARLSTSAARGEGEMLQPT